MGKESNDPSKYWRSGVAIPVRFKPQLDERLAQTGLKTVGDLLNLFVHGEGVPEVLAPLQQTYAASKVVTKVSATDRREAAQKLDDQAIDMLKNATPEQLAIIQAAIRSATQA